MKNQTNSFKTIASLALVNSMLLCSQANATNVEVNKFPLSHSGDSCLPLARGKVRVTPLGNVEVMDVKIEGLPKNTAVRASGKVGNLVKVNKMLVVNKFIV